MYGDPSRVPEEYAGKVTNHGAIESIEVERKYEVDAAAQLPGAEAFAALGLRLGEPETHRLRANYFDTAEGSLAKLRCALRRRQGGKDAGWHLKMKGDESHRELMWPESEEMPAGMRAELIARIGEDAVSSVATIATLNTVRTTAVVYAADGRPLIELADDLVDAVNELSGRAQQWREWEAELLPGADAARLDEIEPLLIAAGATRVRGTSKIQRTMQG